MAVSVALNTPLAEALSNVVQPKLVEVGWSMGGLDDLALVEYIILMLVNGKTQEQIAAELSNDLLNLGPDDSGAVDFSRWLFEQVEVLSRPATDNTTTQPPLAAQQPQTQAIPTFTSNENRGPSRRGSRQFDESAGQDAEMSEAMDAVQDGSIPTGPKSMRNGGRPGNKRLMGQLSKAMDRSSDAILHRVRPQQGTERIGAPNRQPPKGPRGDGMKIRGVHAGVPTGPSHGPPNRGPAAALMQMSPQQQMQLFAMYEQQARMMTEILNPQQQQMLMPAINPAFRNGIPKQPTQPSRSLFERIERKPQQRNGVHHNHRVPMSGVGPQNGTTFISKAHTDVDMGNNDLTSSMEVESSQTASTEPSPDTICKFNLKCTKPDCIYAHQSPAAPPDTAIDASDHCSFGAACKNRKCVARHPSPAQKITHQSEQDCKFFPNCTNPGCPFRHPTMPMCRNGADCTREGCKFTHVRTKCRFNPCLNASCVYKHEEGQKRGKFDDKVWQADGSQEREHVSERKFVVDDEAGEEELIVPGNQMLGGSDTSLAAEPHRRCCAHTRTYTSGHDLSQNNHKVEEVAVLGGGITGLASAFYISKAFKDVPITLYEAGSRLGGWLRSSSVDVSNGNVVFEQGPRTLRPSIPNGMVTLDLIRQLRLQDDILMTSKESVAARNRYIYYPDRLVRMPGPGSSILGVLSSMLSEPVFQGLLYGFATEIFQPARDDLGDESVGDFLSRRVGSSVADNIVSAVIHGIYAGDIYQLSARSILGKLYQLEDSYGSLILGNILEASRDDPLAPSFDAHLMKYLKPFMVGSDGTPVQGTEVIALTRESSVYTFRRGIGQLAESLENALSNNPKVTILTNNPIETLELITHNQGSKVFPNTERLFCMSSRSSVQMQLTPSKKQNTSTEPSNHRYSHVVSTISGKTLSSITQPASCLSPLALTPSVTVMVVNLYYTNPELLPVHGFGYLLPRSLPFEQNPERALGVVFDSDATIGQEHIPGTKLTVMLGGHWWDGWETYPDEGEGASMAKSILARHLGIVEQPSAVRVGLHRDCIPQYTVGHAARMKDASKRLLDYFQGRLRVAGNSYTGVGLNDCVRAAKELTMRLSSGARVSGLEDLAAGCERWVRRKKGSDIWGSQ
ncbi:hypothetical protein MMC13_002799 [Lambiella insularis]|nr:hypothetical protein [Lambiella insularis]